MTTTRLKRFGIVVVMAIWAMAGAGCVAGKAVREGDEAMKAGNLDEAVAAYRRAVQSSPDNPNYKIALQRAQLEASRSHFDKARDFEQKDQLEAALGEYKQASEYDPTNRVAGSKVAELDRTIRERIEASRPKPAIQQLRERARAASPEPILNPTNREPLNIRFNNASLRDILAFIGNNFGINMSYDREVTDRPATANFDGVTLEQALNLIMTMNQLSYKVVSDRSIFVFPDTGPKHVQYDEQVVRTFYISNADATELTQILSVIVRLPGIAIQPAIAANKTANTITVRGTSSMVQILEKLILQNDKPRAEIVVDVEILEVDRTRTKSYGLNLTEYGLGAIFSPEVSPSASTTTPAATTPSTGTTTPSTPSTSNTGTSTAPSGVKSPPVFNLNTISRGINTADFYLAVPAAIVKFLESDTHNKLLAKPQLRGAEGTKLSLVLGDQIPIISTSYTPIATGGAGVNPLSSYQYKDVGVNVDMTPYVTNEGDIRLDMTVESSTRKADVTIAGVNIPSFGTRKVTSRLRLRDGESNLLAGLLQESERKSLTGFPGAIHVPVLKELFSANDQEIDQTDIVMLLTPHIVRTHEITEDDLKPIYIGSQQNLGIGGPPPLIQPPPADVAPPAPAAPAGQPGQPVPAPGAPGQPGAGTTPAGAFPAPGGAVVVAPPGTSPVPGTVLVPPSPAPPAPTPTVPPEPTPTPAAPAEPAAAQPPPIAAGPTTPAQAAAAANITTTPGVGSAQVIISSPPTPMQVGGGPYTIPLSITDASRISTLTLTLIFDPTKLRVQTVTEGSFMRSGGVNVTFSQQVSGNRIDITLARAADATGASGTGLLAAVLFTPIASGSVTLQLSGTATGPGGTAMGLRFSPVTVTVQ
ncbi:MAG TPA: FecR domain-containing protein [Vicinamibacterales bacterium]|nr:FecR domain-containing protein [Vicinamibacterales bacterium]